MPDTGEIAVWTAVGTSDGLLCKRVQRAQTKVADLAIWRGEDGQVRAWNNRCPHRGMRLSYGFVRGNRLTCLYHGWTYNGTGACALIPAHPNLTPPKTITATVYKAMETGGLIWVTSSETQEAPSFSGSWRAIRSIFIAAPAKAVDDAVETLRMESGSLLKAPLRGTYLHELKDGVHVICALQEINDHSVMMQIAVDDGENIDRNRRIDSWARKIRRVAEEAAAASMRDRPVMERR